MQLGTEVENKKVHIYGDVDTGTGAQPYVSLRLKMGPDDYIETGKLPLDEALESAKAELIERADGPLLPVLPSRSNN